MNELKTNLATLLGTVVGHLVNGLFLMLAWNAIAAAADLPTFSYIVYVAIAWTVRWVLKSLAPTINNTGK